MIKHAFKSYPKVKIGGSFAVEEPAMTEDQEEVDLYGFDAEGIARSSCKSSTPHNDGITRN
jgi:hypothetical protein